MAGRAPRKLIVLVVVLAGFFLAGQISGSAATQRATTYPNAKQRGQDFYMHLMSPTSGTQIAWHQGIEVDFTWGTDFYCTDPGCPIKLAIGTTRT